MYPKRVMSFFICIITVFSIASGVLTEAATTEDFMDGMIVKMQRTDYVNSSADLRIISVTDSLDYSAAGFDIELGDKTTQVLCTKAYTSITAYIDGVARTYTPKDISDDAEFFYTYIIKSVPTDSLISEYKITPFVITPDGAKSYGVLKEVKPLKEIVCTSPANGTENIYLVKDEVKNYWQNSVSGTDICDYADGTDESKCKPLPVKLTWEGVATPFTVKISENADMSDAVEYEDYFTYKEIYNLKVGTRYYWQVVASNCISKVQTFTTAANQPRLIYTENIRNMRDVGGYTTIDGQRIKQGLVYRSAELDGYTSNDLATLKDLGIAIEMDFRETATYPIPSLEINATSIKWYTLIFENENKAAIGYAFKNISRFNGAPAVYHCSIGRDRTGTVTMLLYALLGVDEDTIRKEYFLSYFSSVGASDGIGYTGMKSNVDAFLNALKRYKSSSLTLRENAEAYLLDCKVKEKEIANIKAALLENE